MLMDESTGGSNGKNIVPTEETSGAVQILLDGLNWIYKGAVGGGFGFPGAKEFAESYRAASGGDVEEAIDSLIAWQVGKAGAAGFISNIGGLITLPVAIPANLGAVLYIQLNMVAAIAHLRCYDIESDQVRTFSLACLAGGGAVDLLKDVGVQMGAKIAAQAIQSISGATLIRLNQAVGFRLVTKAGTTGLVNLSKLVPFFGGIVGGAIDGSTTRLIGSAAKALFPTVRSRGPEDLACAAA